MSGRQTIGAATRAGRPKLWRPSFWRRVAVWLALGVAVCGQALAQGPAPVARPQATQQQIEELRAKLDAVTDPIARLSQAIAAPGGVDAASVGAAVQAIARDLADAKRLAASVDFQTEQTALAKAAEDNAIFIILSLIAGFVLLSLVVILVLSGQVRRSFYERAAQDPDGHWRKYLMKLPLGAPEGSVRALLSMFVVVFGLLVLVMQKRLGLPSVDVIAGFVGIVITFYFTSRSNDQAQKANDQAQKAVGEAVDAAREATAAAKNSLGTATQVQTEVKDAIDRHLAGSAANTAGQVKDAVAAALGKPDAPAAPPAADGQSRLRVIQGDLQLTRQVMGALKGLGVGSQLFAGAESLAGNADALLGTIDKALQGGASGPELARVAGSAEQLLGTLGEVGVPGVLGGAISVLTSVMKVGGPALGGLALGPVGVVAGLVTGGLGLLADERKFNAWKTAVLAKPFDRSLLPPSVDGNAALIALEVAPLMAKRLEGAAPNVATELLRACIAPAADGNPRPIADLAHEMLADAADPLGLRGRFGSETELREALEEYRTGAIFVRARDTIGGQIAIPALPGSPAASIDLGALVTGALKLHQDPRAGAALEKVVYLVQALGALHLDPGRLAAVVQAGLETGAAMVGGSRTAEDMRT